MQLLLISNLGSLLALTVCDQAPAPTELQPTPAGKAVGDLDPPTNLCVEAITDTSARVA